MILALPLCRFRIIIHAEQAGRYHAVTTLLYVVDATGRIRACDCRLVNN